MNRLLMALPLLVGTVAMTACILVTCMVGQAHAISLKDVEATNVTFSPLKLCSGILQGIAETALKHGNLIEMTPERAVEDRNATLDGDPSQHLVYVWTCRPTPTGMAIDFKATFRRF